MSGSRTFLYLLLVLEGIVLLLQFQFIAEYTYNYRAKLFRPVRRRNNEGDLSNFDPDYDIEIPPYINRYPPEVTFQQIDKLYYENQIQEYMTGLVQIKLTKEILMSNLQPKPASPSKLADLSSFLGNLSSNKKLM
mmetsp:Transcript_5857/g.9439  ORF Transcript_5857/g.9439 Transcript_5857/m.9439 type:complete len:135 (+) Transcript_5857:618-1022(+)